MAKFKRGTFDVAISGLGKLPIPALIHGGMAVHRGVGDVNPETKQVTFDGRWVVSNCHCGLQCGIFNNQKRAKAAALEFIGAGVGAWIKDMSDTLTPEEREKLRAISRVRD